MLLPLGNIEAAYTQIRDDSLSGACTVLIFAAPTVDSLCACRSLLLLLKQDFIQFKLVPVFGFEDLARANEELIQGNDQLKSIVMIDCGGQVDLGEFLSLGEDMTVYLFDSHRPIHLVNLFDNEQVVVIGDHELDEDLRPVQVAHQYNSDDEDERDVAEEDETDITAEADDADENRARQKRKRAESQLGERQLRRQQRRRVLRDYYNNGSWYGMSVALTMWLLAEASGRQTSELLWMAIVGLTDQYIHERIDSQQYNDARDRLTNEVSKFHPELPASQEAIASRSLMPHREDGSHMRITFSMEYQFMLFRHWSLFDAMFHSPYLATRLGTWRERGKKKLLELLALAGLPLKEVTQPFANMALEVKNTLHTQLQQVCKRNDTVFHKLADITYGSFVIQVGFKMMLSAADVVYAISALLEAGPVDKPRNEDNSTSINTFVNDDDVWTRNFFDAYDALDNQKLEQLQEGLQRSMAFQRAIVRQGTALIDKRGITTTKQFRFSILSDGTDIRFFAHPLTLTRLALFLLMALQESHKQVMPIVLAALRPYSDTFIVVGVNSHTDMTDTRKNKFSIALRKAAESAGASFKHDGFESSVIEMQRGDLTHFLETLQANSATLLS